MKKTVLVTALMVLLVSGPAMAQMMGGGSNMMGVGSGTGTGQQMMEQQQMQKYAPTGGQHYNPYMNPGMMGGYGYGMGPGMMGYGMGANMMGGYGYSMPMMGGYSYGMHPGMMIGGYGMGHHQMMHGYTGYPGMMGYYSPEHYEKEYKEHQEFLNETKELRKKLHTLKFDFAEAQRDPEVKREDLEKMNSEMERIWKEIYTKKIPATK